MSFVFPLCLVIAVVKQWQIKKNCGQAKNVPFFFSFFIFVFIFQIFSYREVKSTPSRSLYMANMAKSQL